MQAIVINRYGGPEVLELKEIERPTLKEDGVLVRVHAASLNAGDLFSVRGSPWLARLMVGFPRPKDYVLGWDFAGRVEAVGKEVTRLRPGDEVYSAANGAFAEFAAAPEAKVALMPAGFTFEQAAALPTAATTALKGLRDVGRVRPGQKVLINGASGGVGHFAVQIASALGAEVSAVCSTRNVEMVRALGAQHVFDYTREDFTRSGQQYDLILDNVSSRSFADLRRALAPQGQIVPNSGYGGMGYVLRAYALSAIRSGQQQAPFTAVPTGQDLDALSELVAAGTLAPVIDRSYPLAETPAALRSFADEHPRGKVVIAVAA